MFSFFGVPASAQEAGGEPALFIAPIVEAVYSRKSPGAGAGFAFGTEGGVGLGLRAAYFMDMEDIRSVEAGFFIRVFFLNFRSAASFGPFLQVNYGAVIFTRDEAFTLPAPVGMLTAFLSAGWRFPLGRGPVPRYFIEPALRAGYPYFVGAGVSAGYRF
jgi:hypothetical protein